MGCTPSTALSECRGINEGLNTDPASGERSHDSADFAHNRVRQSGP